MRPIIFETLSLGQKYSIINFHTVVGLSDGKINKQEEEILENLLYLCNVNINDSIEYFEKNGKNEQLIDDLISLQMNMKEIVIISIWDLIICDGKPNEKELSITFTILDRLYINEEKFYKILEKKEIYTDILFGY